MILKFISNFLYIIIPIIPSLSLADDWVYTWSSKNNKSHYYSDKPLNLIPESSNYILINSSNLLNKSNLLNEENNKNMENIEKKENNNFKTQNCEIAKKNLQIAKKTNSLSEEDKNSIIQTYTNDINKYCN